jgi:hypothetical protein
MQVGLTEKVNFAWPSNRNVNDEEELKKRLSRRRKGTELAESPATKATKTTEVRRECDRRRNSLAGGGKGTELVTSNKGHLETLDDQQVRMEQDCVRHGVQWQSALYT